MVGVTPHSRAAESLRDLPNLIIDSPEFVKCVDSLLAGEGATFDSVWGSSCALLTAALSHRFSNLLVVCPDTKSLDNHLDDLETFLDSPAQRFPAFVASADPALNVDQDYGERLRIIKDCCAGDLPKVIVEGLYRHLWKLINYFTFGTWGGGLY